MSSVTITPLVEQEAVELSAGSGKWRKQILPRGKFNYKDEVIDFDLIGKQAKEAFDKKALDQVAFQLADGGNNHNFDPKNYRGDVENIELTDEGTFATFDFSKFPDMKDMVEKNPKFGVSARIERDLTRGDGAKFPFAFSHVLGTLNPRVTGMKPWEKVELSNVDGDAEVQDLTGIELSTKEEGVVTDTLKPEEIAAFRKFVADQAVIEDALKNVKLSNEDGTSGDDAATKAVELANTTASNALKLARESQIELAKSRWEKTDSDLRRLGVPPATLNLAKELMELPKGQAIELSNGEGKTLDPQAVLLSVLESLKGTIDLSAGEGHEFSGEGSGEDKDYESFRDDFMRENF